MKKELVIIGGGPAGLAAAVAAYDSGVRDILILERDTSLGGILQQCIHN
ncbi:MAG: FAD-dependent oxidoreductase, partial [Clostridia bacterium]|nr:FAD-dependent oxidoreductase [Clostridia bacterium]